MRTELICWDRPVLDLAVYELHGFVATFVAIAGGVRLFGRNVWAECFVETEQFPARALVAYAATANLPDPHEVVAIPAGTHRVDLHDTRESVVSEFKALTLAKGVASFRLPHDGLDCVNVTRTSPIPVSASNI